LAAVRGGTVYFTVIIKPSKSGKGVVVVDDFGNTYATSKKYLLAVLAGTMKAPFVLMTRMPVPAQMDRFNPSPILAKDNEHIEHDDERWSAPQCSHNIEVSNFQEDGMDRAQAKKRKEKEAFDDITL
jgi:hypothetical protein